MSYCRAYHTDLATIESNDDMLQLQNVVQSQQFSSKAWLGLYNDNNSWHWSYENIPLGNMTAWNSKQPDNNHGNEECGTINRGIWSDMSCTATYPIICFDGEEQYIIHFTKKIKGGL